MDIVIEQIQSSEDVTAMLEVWQQVFEREMGILLSQDSASSHIGLRDSNRAENQSAR